MLSVSLLEMYATQFETLVRMPKRSNKRKAIKNKEELHTREDQRKPGINYFAGVNSVFNTIISK